MIDQSIHTYLRQLFILFCAARGRSLPDLSSGHDALLALVDSSEPSSRKVVDPVKAFRSSQNATFEYSLSSKHQGDVFVAEFPPEFIFNYLRKS